MNKLALKRVSTATKIRVLLLMVTLLNQLVASIGATTYAQSDWYQLFSIVATTIVACINTWYNNDFTMYAMTSSKVFDALKSGYVTEDDIEKLILKGEANGYSE